jgi:hypothetical protein
MIKFFKLGFMMCLSVFAKDFASCPTKSNNNVPTATIQENHTASLSPEKLKELKELYARSMGNKNNYLECFKTPRTNIRLLSYILNSMRFNDGSFVTESDLYNVSQFLAISDEKEVVDITKHELGKNNLVNWDEKALMKVISIFENIPGYYLFQATANEINVSLDNEIEGNVLKAAIIKLQAHNSLNGIVDMDVIEVKVLSSERILEKIRSAFFDHRNQSISFIMHYAGHWTALFITQSGEMGIIDSYMSCYRNRFRNYDDQLNILGNNLNTNGVLDSHDQLINFKRANMNQSNSGILCTNLQKDSVSCGVHALSNVLSVASSDSLKEAMAKIALMQRQKFNSFDRIITNDEAVGVFKNSISQLRSDLFSIVRTN